MLSARRFHHIVFQKNPAIVGKRFSSTANFDGVVVGVFENGQFTSSTKQALDGTTQEKILKQIKLAKNDGKFKQHSLVYNLDGSPERIAVVGLGKASEVKQDENKFKDVVRIASCTGVKLLKSVGASKIGIDSFEGQAQSAAEGAVLGLWKWDVKTAKKSEEDEEGANNNKSVDFSLWPSPQSSDMDAWSQGKIIAESQNFARTLAETPSNMMTPTIFAQTVTSKLNELKSPKVQMIVRDKEWAEQQKMGCFLGVSQGSNEPLKFLELHYRGATSNNSDSSSSSPLLFVGKGITFDSGGISIKPSSGMALMKGDMGGAASVVSAFYGIVALELPVDVTCLVPLCENMPSGTATKPGDVLTAMNGKTVEVDNTDAEGRLILADALHYAHSFNPHTIIDVATLTGAIDVALGSGAYGTFTASDDLWNDLHKASSQTSEHAWRMPMHFPQYKAAIKSRVADLVNSANTRAAGASTAALFLSEFVTHKRWAHLDIAGVMKASNGDALYLGKGGMTGIPTRTLIQLAINHRK